MSVRRPRHRGATKVEYALMLLLVSCTSVLVIGTLGWNIAGMYDAANRPISEAITPASASPDRNGDGSSAAAGNRGNNGRRGNPGQGNAGNAKSVGNAGTQGAGAQGP